MLFVFIGRGKKRDRVVLLNYVVRLASTALFQIVLVHMKGKKEIKNKKGNERKNNNKKTHKKKHYAATVLDLVYIY